MFSNRYIYTFSIIMAIAVAAVLAFVNTSLSDKQKENVRIAKIQTILKSIHIESSPENAVALYNEHLLKEITVNVSGDIVSIYENQKFTQGNSRAFDINMKEAFFKLKTDNSTELPIFILSNKGKTYYIIPILGKGLWGPIWGILAMEEDLETIFGAVFDHKGETPGLGAEISSYEIFQQQFEGKKIYDIDGKLVGITVVKGGVDGSSTPIENGVDAISGGTITSDGVTDMLKSNLKEYSAFLYKQKNK